METTTTQVTTATNHNILRLIKDHGTTKNAVAKAAQIPATTFDRKINGKTDWTIPELGDVAGVFGLTFWDILPGQPQTASKAA